MLLAALLAGCAETDYAPINDAHWNPRDIADSLYEKGAVIYNETPESQRQESSSHAAPRSHEDTKLITCATMTRNRSRAHTKTRR